MEFAGRMSYGDYLKIDTILGAQRPLSGAHDEMLFIIQHQTSELWMRLAIHEIAAARRAIAADALPPAFKMLTRVARIFEQLNNAWDVLRTMTPSEYTEFRGSLGQSSGFQSFQYRQIEYMVGNRNRAMLGPHTHRPEVLAMLEAELAAPSPLRRGAAAAGAKRHSGADAGARPRSIDALPSVRGGRRGVARRLSRLPRGTGRFTNWPRSSSISRTTSAAGASTTSPRSNGLSASSAAPAAPAASAI